ncbi:MAG: hypothetical protein J2P50_09375 [Hyphomicrobiaceae bacterium]|nr:hypothetical protein [Hyphomicrobiaceae bacterium]
MNVIGRKAFAALAVLVLSAAYAEAKTYGELFPGRTYQGQEAQKFGRVDDWRGGR